MTAAIAAIDTIQVAMRTFSRKREKALATSFIAVTVTMPARMFRTLFVAIAIIAALLPGVAIVVCVALIALGLASRILVIVRGLAARGGRVQPASFRALSLLRAPPSLLA